MALRQFLEEDKLPLGEPIQLSIRITAAFTIRFKKSGDDKGN